MPRAVLFDLFNTLIPSGGRALRAATNARIAEILGVDPDAFDAAFIGAAAERYTGAFGDLTDTLRALAERVGGRPDAERLAKAVAVRSELPASQYAAVREETVSALDDVRAGGWRTGLVSNTTPGSPDGWWSTPLAARMDALAFSNLVGVAKPDPGIYLHACEALGIPPQDCWYVGDGEDRELAGARALGMTAVRTTEYALSDPGWNGPSIGKLSDLVALLPR